MDKKVINIKRGAQTPVLFRIFRCGYSRTIIVQLCEDPHDAFSREQKGVGNF